MTVQTFHLHHHFQTKKLIFNYFGRAPRVGLYISIPRTSLGQAVGFPLQSLTQKNALPQSTTINYKLS